jgi:integral membrane sensor domain MASE1
MASERMGMLKPIANQKDGLTDGPIHKAESPASLLIIALLVFAAYYIGAALSFALRVPSTRSSIIWAPNAVLLAALVATPPRTWWIWLIAALPAHVLAQARDAAPILHPSDRGHRLVAQLFLKIILPRVLT